MLSRLREHLGGAGLIVAIVALVAALAGGAIAANGGAGDGKATASAKAKKGPRGPKGPKGDTGPAGPAGPAGPQGAKGDTGAAGANGSNGAAGATGATGANGTSVTTTSFGGSKGSCTEGGVEVKSASPAVLICNGKTGATGETGFTKTLPPGETETGTWGIAFNEFGIADASFPIPLAAPIPGANAKRIAEGGTVPPECDDGSGEAPSPANPEADPGFFCVFTTAFEGGGSILIGGISDPGTGISGAGKTGAVISVISAAQDNGLGTWAVTAPLTP